MPPTTIHKTILFQERCFTSFSSVVEPTLSVERRLGNVGGRNGSRA